MLHSHMLETLLLVMSLTCYMIVMASDILETNIRNTYSLHVYIPKPNVKCYRSLNYADGMV